MKTNRIYQSGLMLVAAVLMMSMSTLPTNTNAYDPSGEWAYEVPSPDGTIEGTMKISKDGEDFAVTIYTDQFGDLELEDITMDEMTMEANCDVNGDNIEFEFLFDGDTMEGIVYTPDGEMDITAERE